MLLAFMLRSPLRVTTQPYRVFRLLSTTSAKCNHYEILGIPRTASKIAVKANFYKLSKKYHPDVNVNDKEAKEKFQAVSEAYSVLGDDRKRRAYDRELSTHTSSDSAFARPSQAHSYYYDPSYMYGSETRRRSASYAWENARRGPRARTSRQPPPPPPPPYSQHFYRDTHRSSPRNPQEPPKGRDPFSSVHVRRATGNRTPYETGEDRLRKEGVAMRIGQVLGLMFFIAVLSGGLSAR